MMGTTSATELQVISAWMDSIEISNQCDLTGIQPRSIEGDKNFAKLECLFAVFQDSISENGILSATFGFFEMSVGAFVNLMDRLPDILLSID